LQDQAGVHHILTGGAQMHIALGPGIVAAINLPNAFTSGIAELPAVAIATPRASTSYSAARHAWAIGATAACGINPTEPRHGPARFEIQHALQAALVAEHLAHAAAVK
jgi:hypothetical protein